MDSADSSLLMQRLDTTMGHQPMTNQHYSPSISLYLSLSLSLLAHDYTITRLTLPALLLSTTSSQVRAFSIPDVLIVRVGLGLGLMLRLDIGFRIIGLFVVGIGLGLGIKNISCWIGGSLVEWRCMMLMLLVIGVAVRPGCCTFGRWLGYTSS